MFTILSAIVQGVLGTVRIEEPYALDDGRKWSISDQMLTYCAYVSYRLREESGCCEQKVNKRPLAESDGYFGLNWL